METTEDYSSLCRIHDLSHTVRNFANDVLEAYNATITTAKRGNTKSLRWNIALLSLRSRHLSLYLASLYVLVKDSGFSDLPEVQDLVRQAELAVEDACKVTEAALNV